jgi:exodeoxyribonuclease V alpha subunit
VALGLRELNVKLQAALNPVRPEEPVVEKFGWLFRVRDKVIQTENNYDILLVLFLIVLLASTRW